METLPDIYFEWGYREMAFNYKAPITWVGSDGKLFEQGFKEIEIPINLN